MFDEFLKSRKISDKEYKILLDKDCCFTCLSNCDKYNRNIHIIGCKKHRNKYGSKTQSFCCSDYKRHVKE